MKIRNYVTALIAGLSLTAVPLAEAQGKGKGKDKPKGKPSTSQKGKSSEKPGKDKPKKMVVPGEKGGPQKDDWRKHAKFEDKDRDSILSHWGSYKDNDKGLPPGLAKNLRRGKPLPPGWEKKVRSGWMIEEDWWGLFDRVPSTYLPAGFILPKDTGVFLFGDRLLRVHEPTKEVLDFVRIPTIKL